jgi:HKD family nuclease
VFRYQLILQGETNEDAILDAVSDLASAAAFTRLRASFAFANGGGAQQLTERLEAALSDWDLVTKQWLISIDFGFTDPRALDLLQSQPKSKVRIPDAYYLIANRLQPRRSFHPKSLLLDAGQAPGKTPIALLVGSANMTVSGLRKGQEHAVTVAWTGTNTAALRNRMKATQQEAKRFAADWYAAHPLDAPLLKRYEDAHRRAREARRWPDEDDNPEIRELARDTVATKDFEKAAELTRAKHLWVEAGNISENLKVGGPGNQLDLQRGTRAFFGLGTRTVPPNSPLGHIDIHYGASGPIERNMRFGDNTMDKLDLPYPGSPGPPAYDGETLLFTRRPDGAFDLRLGTASEIEEWKDKSRARGTLYALRKGSGKKAREFGVF